jgi:D-serine deaminase-like pyridoxal phosphate-dependent protein
MEISMRTARAVPQTATEKLTGRNIHVDDVPTPIVYVDDGRLESNLARMSAAATRIGVSLRPHAKTHKIPEVARAQLAHGAIGLTVAKLAEAQALLDAGVQTSFLVAQPYWGSWKAAWQLDLAETCEVLACVDNIVAARELSGAARRGGRVIDVVLIIDTGYGRFGVQPADALAVAKRLSELPGVRLRGMRSHPGHAYRARTRDRRQAVAREDATILSDIAAAFDAEDISSEIVSTGSTPSHAELEKVAARSSRVTEIRPGNYAFYDRMQVSLGTASIEDCAIRLITTVVSTPVRGTAVIDAGKKTLTSTLDPLADGYGLVVNKAGVEIFDLSEECGRIRYSGPELRVGDRLEVIPNHACEIPNLADSIAHGSHGIIHGFWRAVGRGQAW